MRILCIGDVVANCGCKTLLAMLPKVKRELNIDACIVNGENSAQTNGITSESAEMIFAAGADVITGGNHTLKQESFLPLLDQNPNLLRPYNIKCDYGDGYLLYDMGKESIAVINLLGQAFMERHAAQNPFDAAQKLTEKAKADGATYTVVDFHAEATSEKRALGFFLDGKVSAFFGTHTHVQTADAQVLPLGTGYITDVGMTGAKDTVLGVKKEIIIDRFHKKDMQKFEYTDGASVMSGCVFELNPESGLCVSCQNVCFEREER